MQMCEACKLQLTCRARKALSSLPLLACPALCSKNAFVLYKGDRGGFPEGIHILSRWC